MYGKLKSVVLLLQPLCRLCGANARNTSKGDTYVHEQLFLVFAHSEFLVIQTCTVSSGRSIMISTTYDHTMAMLVKSGDGDSIFSLEIPSTAKAVSATVITIPRMGYIMGGLVLSNYAMAVSSMLQQDSA
ncbi:hypothetical protein EDD22DRAFT_854861 [Suillus occidentalis]|nr:hypothetical protein EDD22DRAFT_854861 [Suillus occidentalis]